MLDEFIRQCEARGGRVEHDPHGGSRCITDSGASGGGGGQGSPQANKAVVNGLGAIAFVLIMPFAPMHVIMLLAPQTDAQKSEDRKRSNEEFQKVKRAIKDRERRGREAAELAKQLANAEASASDEMASAKARVTPIPFNPPKLVPSTSYSCTRAEMVMWYREGWPLEGFESQGDYRSKCGPFTPAKASAAIDPTTNACSPDLLTCGGTQHCCPKDAPLLNLCDTNCYRTPHDIFGAIEEPAMRCSRYVDCGSNIK
jgi:hypothetical protein